MTHIHTYILGFYSSIDKGFHSVVLLALVDAEYRFLYSSIRKLQSAPRRRDKSGSEDKKTRREDEKISQEDKKMRLEDKKTRREHKKTKSSISSSRLHRDKKTKNRDPRSRQVDLIRTWTQEEKIMDLVKSTSWGRKDEKTRYWISSNRLHED